MSSQISKGCSSHVEVCMVHVSNQDLVKSVLFRDGVQRFIGTRKSGLIMMFYLNLDKFDSG